MPVRSCKSTVGRSTRVFSLSDGSCDGGRESGMWDVGVADEFGNGGTGGRFRTGVEGA